MAVSGLSDKDISMDTGVLSKISSEWSTAVSSANLGSVDVSGQFSSLTQNGVAVGYLTSLKNALEKIEKTALKIANLVATTASDQEAADESGKNKSNQSTPRTTSGGNRGGNYGGSNNSSANNSDKNTDIKSDQNTDIKSEDDPSTIDKKDDKDLEIKDDETKKVELDETEVIAMATSLQSIIEGKEYDYLFDTSFASQIKEQLLKSPNLTDDLKAKIAEMDENEVQVFLKEMYLSGEGVSDFSKIIITIFDNDLRQSNSGSTVEGSAKSISAVYNYLKGQSNLQEQLKDLYYGTTDIDGADDDVIRFTRSFIDTVATATNTTYEEVLKDSKYQETLSAEVQDISKTFTTIDVASKAGAATASVLCSNLIIKE